MTRMKRTLKTRKTKEMPEFIIMLGKTIRYKTTIEAESEGYSCGYGDCERFLLEYPLPVTVVVDKAEVSYQCALTEDNVKPSPIRFLQMESLFR